MVQPRKQSSTSHLVATVPQMSGDSLLLVGFHYLKKFNSHEFSWLINGWINYFLEEEIQTIQQLVHLYYKSLITYVFMLSENTYIFFDSNFLINCQHMIYTTIISISVLLLVYQMFFLRLSLLGLWKKSVQFWWISVPF